MAIRGQRFRIDLDSDEEANAPKPTIIPAPSAGSFFGLVSDVKERTSSFEHVAPSPPKLKSAQTGFPSHKKQSKPSRFKQRRTDLPAGDDGEINPTKPSTPSRSAQANVNGNASTTRPYSERDSFSASGERQRIDEENRERLAQMSPAEIEEAREELMNGLNPSLIERLLKKANIDDESINRGPAPEDVEVGEALSASKQVTLEEPVLATDPALQSTNYTLDTAGSDAAAAVEQPSHLNRTTEGNKAPQLDPSSPNFITELHDKYFPELPTDPSVLSWMQPLPKTSSYDPSAESVPVAAIRFDFRGHILPPRLSSQLPSTLGLHHHAHAPSSAGYTVPELAHLARSTFPAQRCIAMQTLGRILYRLGRGDFGLEGEDLCEGLWDEMERGRVIDILVEAAGGNGEKGNRSVWVTATEAVWLWRRGGGRRWKGR